MADFKVRLKNKDGVYLYPQTQWDLVLNKPVAETYKETLVDQIVKLIQPTADTGATNANFVFMMRIFGSTISGDAPVIKINNKITVPIDYSGVGELSDNITAQGGVFMSQWILGSIIYDELQWSAPLQPDAGAIKFGQVYLVTKGGNKQSCVQIGSLEELSNITITPTNSTIRIDLRWLGADKLS